VHKVKKKKGCRETLTRLLHTETLSSGLGVIRIKMRY
jgi:hypothetical protein